MMPRIRIRRLGNYDSRQKLHAPSILEPKPESTAICSVLHHTKEKDVLRDQSRERVAFEKAR